MKVSVDISLYPLKEDYKAPILAFIEALENQPDIEVVRNDLATQIYGEYRMIMDLLDENIERTLSAHEASVFVIKLVGGNRLGQNT